MKTIQKSIFLFILLFISSPLNANTIEVKVNGLVCEFCAIALEKTFTKDAKQEVESVEVNLSSKIVTIHLNKGAEIKDNKIKKLINNAGYSILEITREDNNNEENN